MLPLVLLVWDYSQSHLTANPIQAATIRSGRTALVMLFLSLACTPALAVTGVSFLVWLRRMLGLYSFGYAGVHFVIFTGFDYGFDPSFIGEALFEKPFALAGLASFLILAVLALTSTSGWMGRLGPSWRRLHRTVYLAAFLAVIHYLWSVKAERSAPLLLLVLLILLVLLRLPAIETALRHWRARPAT